MQNYYVLVKKQMTDSLSQLRKTVRVLIYQRTSGSASSILQQRFFSGEECVWHKTENIYKAGL